MIGLERAQTLARKICGIWGDEYGFAEPNTVQYRAILELADMATQIGYEQAIGKKHKSSDYGMSQDFAETLPNKCAYCRAQYFAYGCEDRCSWDLNDEECGFQV
jgi:hypothetical protein